MGGRWAFEKNPRKCGAEFELNKACIAETGLRETSARNREEHPGPELRAFRRRELNLGPRVSDDFTNEVPPAAVRLPTRTAFPGLKDLGLLVRVDSKDTEQIQ